MKDKKKSKKKSKDKKSKKNVYLEEVKADEILGPWDRFLKWLYT